MIRKLARSIRENIWAAILSPLCMVGEVYMEVQIPRIIAALVDKGIQVSNTQVVWQQGLLLVLSALCSLMFGVGSAVFAAKAATGFSRNLRHDMFYRVQTFDFGNIDKFSTASIITRLTSDVANIQMCFQMMIRMAVRCPVMVVLACINVFRISPKLCLVYLIALPILALGLYILIRLVHPVFERAFKILDKLNNVVQENLHGMRVVKSFVREDKEEEKFTTVAGDVKANFMRAERIMAFNNPLMQLTIYTCVIAISYLGAKLIVDSGNTTFTTGDLTSMFTYTTQILGGLMMLSMVFVMITMSRAPMERCAELLGEEPALRSPANAVMEVKDGSVDFENVDFRYSAQAKKNALEQVNIHIEAGQTVGILGATGSSKSTLVQLIPRLYDATGGSVKVGGVDVKDYDLKALRDQVAMVLQKNVLFAGSIKDNLRWGNPDATDEEMEHACRLACAHDFITSFPDGYDTHIEQGGKNVSGGQKQRLCIARALLKKPKILILDDSTSAVDTHTDAMIRKAFAEEIPGTTKFIIAQRIASVQEADVILVMDGGQVVDQGNHEQLMASSQIYREVYESQVKGGEE